MWCMNSVMTVSLVSSCPCFANTADRALRKAAHADISLSPSYKRSPRNMSVCTPHILMRCTGCSDNAPKTPLFGGQASASSWPALEAQQDEHRRASVRPSALAALALLPGPRCPQPRPLRPCGLAPGSPAWWARLQAGRPRPAAG